MTADPSDPPKAMATGDSVGPPESRNLIEIGVVVAGPLDSIDQTAALQACRLLEQRLTETLPDFSFKLLRSRRPQLSGNGRVEPSELLQQAAEDRDKQHWDFAFVLTASELAGVYSPFCFAALSRPLDSAVISLSLIDPQATKPDTTDSIRIERIAHRLTRLMLHALGHLTGLSARDDPRDLMFHPATAEDLDEMDQISDDQLQRQSAALAQIADLRLEESPLYQKSYLLFVLRAAWINRREIAEAIWGARPWEFPRRLSRLTIAAVSTIAVLFMTAEAWDLGLSQSSFRIAILLLISWAVTTVYVIVRQQLLIRRGRESSEQTVVTSVAALGIVLVGMAVTWLSLLLIGLVMGELLFRPRLVASWASSSGWGAEEIGLAATAQMSCFSASLGLLIGALGASFESQHYFRHVIFVDEEI